MHDEPATVSAIVPVYNGAQFIAETIDSILTQTRQVDELIVVDDGSTDDTASAVAQFGTAVRYVRQDNQGPAAARNRGIAMANGTFLAFLDADDRWMPEKISVQLQRMLDEPSWDMSFTHFQNTWEDDLEAEREAFASHKLAQPVSGWCIGTLMARRATFATFGRFDDSIRQCENISWFLDTKSAGARIEILPDTLMLRRFHPTSLTRRATPETLDGFLSVLKKWKDGSPTLRAPG